MQDYPEIYLKDLSLVIGRQVILRGINTRFTGGKIYGLIGHNGSGKTMLMKCICGFVRPTAGGVRINGKWLGLEQDFPESLGALIEAPGFLPYYTGQKNLRLLAGLRGQAGEVEILRAMRAVGLNPAERKTVGKYSLGMRQRLGIAQAVMESPELLILDEPMNGLDPDGAAQVRGLLRALKEENRIILLASHIQQDILELCDAVCRMQGGELQECVPE